MRDRVVTIISRVMNIPADELNDDSSPDNTKNWDSLKHMSLILTLEEELGVTFSDDEVVNMMSLAAIVDTIEKKASNSV